MSKGEKSKLVPEKIAHDQDYKDNQMRCKREWMDKHKGYYQDYRKRHPEYVERNKILQAIRDIKRRKKDKPSILLAKIDSLRVKLVPI